MTGPSDPLAHIVTATWSLPDDGADQRVEQSRSPTAARRRRSAATWRSRSRRRPAGPAPPSAPRPGSRASPRGPMHQDLAVLGRPATGSWSQRSRPDASSRTRRQPRGPSRKVASAVRPTSTSSSGSRYSTMAVASEDGPLRASSASGRSERASRTRKRLERHAGQGPVRAAQRRAAAAAAAGGRPCRPRLGQRCRRPSSSSPPDEPPGAGGRDAGGGWARPTANPAPALATTAMAAKGATTAPAGRCDGERLTRRW